MSDNKKQKNSANAPREAVPPIFKVVAGGVTIDYTDKIKEAQASFNEAAARPKALYSVFGRDVQCLGLVN
jgi:hypothetical protein